MMLIKIVGSGIYYCKVQTGAKSVHMFSRFRTLRLRVVERNNFKTELIK